MKKVLCILLSVVVAITVLVVGFNIPVAEASRNLPINNGYVQPDALSTQVGGRWQVTNRMQLWLFNANGTDTGLRLPQGGEIEVRRAAQNGLVRVRITRNAGTGLSMTRDFYASTVAFQRHGALVPDNTVWNVVHQLWLFNNNGIDTGQRLNRFGHVRLLPRLANQSNNVHRVEIRRIPAGNPTGLSVGVIRFVDASVFNSGVLEPWYFVNFKSNY